MLMHSLRKDGFMYVASKGNWANLTSKPIALRRAELLINAQAPVGEVRVQLSDMDGQPFPGFRSSRSAPR